MQTVTVIETEAGTQSHFQVWDRSIVHEIDVVGSERLLKLSGITKEDIPKE